jgi:hypothetical protein
MIRVGIMTRRNWRGPIVSRLRVAVSVCVLLPVLAVAGIVLGALWAPPAQAAAGHPTKYQVKTLNHMLGAFTAENVTSFTRLASPSNRLLVRFGVWRTFHTNSTAVQFDDIYGFLSSDTVDTVEAGARVQALGAEGE